MPLLGRIYGLLQGGERRVLLALVFVALATAAFLGYAYWESSTIPVPVRGGSYSEGTVAASIADLTSTIDHLTKIGFVRFDEEQAIVPAAAERWEVSDEGRTYTFFMRSSLSRELIEQALVDSEKLFPDISVEVNDQHQVIFRLTQAFAPFLATTAAPIFPVGPFEVAERQKGLIRFTAREDAPLGAPYLSDVTLKVYTDTFNLTQALADGDIQGVDDVSHIENERLLDKLAVWNLELPRTIYAFFNLDREVLKSAEVRQKLRDNKPHDPPVQLTLVTLVGEKNEALAQDLVERWAPLGVQITIQAKTSTELAEQIIPKREYDILVYGLDFGSDPDPYPFWHSSQITEAGLNLSNFANLDADRLLEKARQTTDQAQRDALYAQFQEIFIREVPAIELERVTMQFATDKGLLGAQSSSGFSLADRFSQVTSWYRKVQRVRPPTES